MRFACPRCGIIVEAPSAAGLVCQRCGFAEAAAPAWTPDAAAATAPVAAPTGPAAALTPIGWPTHNPWSTTVATPGPAAMRIQSYSDPDDPRYTYGPPETRQDGFAVAGFVLAFLPMLCVLGIIFSSVGLARVRADPGLRGKGLAQAGLTVSITLTVILALFIAQVDQPL